ncbi:heme peroxidase family protein [Kribbella hippodromi]|uniref:Heme peroxidase family protein n=1 Tax=Kribbella hippodromi TaxID=434347 RepID=A0ABN2DLW4_9ACTN
MGTATSYTRAFALPPFAEHTPEVVAALLELGRENGPLDARDDLTADPGVLASEPGGGAQDAVSAFFGQFISHDLSLDPRTRLARPADPQLTTNHRTPWLDLDSVYGGGPPALHFDPKNPALLKIGSNGQYEDVPRAPDGTTMTYDLRNDDTLMLSALHAAFLRFHNHVAERLRASRVKSFAAYRREVVWHYQWIIRHEYLPALVEPGTRITGIAPPGAGLPVELQLALRFGHAQLRPAYQVNDKLTAYLFSPDKPDLRGGRPDPDRYVDWRHLLATAARPLRRSVCTPLFRLPRHANPAGDPPVSLPQRDLLRHLTWQIPSGQAIAAALGVPVLSSADLAELQPYDLDRSTPLWYYLLAEAEVVTAGAMLGPLGSRLLAETVLGPLTDPVHAAPADWRPTLPSATPNHFTLADLFALAGVLDR